MVSPKMFGSDNVTVRIERVQKTVVTPIKTNLISTGAYVKKQDPKSHRKHHNMSPMKFLRKSRNQLDQVNAVLHNATFQERITSPGERRLSNQPLVTPATNAYGNKLAIRHGFPHEPIIRQAPNQPRQKSRNQFGSPLRTLPKEQKINDNLRSSQY